LPAPMREKKKKNQSIDRAGDEHLDNRKEQRRVPEHDFWRRSRSFALYYLGLAFGTCCSRR
jgi:hypothetical protein